MKPDHASCGAADSKFHTIQWALVMAAAKSQAQGDTAVLAELRRLHWNALCSFARRRGYSADDGQDLALSFFLHAATADGGQGKSLTFDPLQILLGIGDSEGMPSAEGVGNERRIGIAGVKTLIHRTRKQHAAISRQEVAPTAPDPVQIDEVIHALCNALIRDETEP